MEPILPLKPNPIPTPMNAYSISGSWSYPDKSGTMYHMAVGRLGPNQQWGLHVFRTPPGKKAELLLLIPDANGSLEIVNRTLRVVWCDPQGKQWWQEIPGFIYWDDKPSGTTVNINEAQVATLKQQIATAQQMAGTAQGTATTALNKANSQDAKIASLERQIAAMQNQISNLQNQILSKQQIEDIVWSKIWDVNYLIRMGFLQGSSSIQQVQDYLNDLTVFIKRVVGK